MAYRFYVVRSGDQLFNIMLHHYGAGEFSRNRDALIANLKRNNPRITDINRIMPGQTIVLPDIQYGLDTSMELNRREVDCATHFNDVLTRLPDPEKRFVSEVDLHLDDDVEADKWFAKAHTAGDRYIELVKHSIESATDNYNEIIKKYNGYKSGVFTKGQYDYARKIQIEKSKKELGAFASLIDGKRKPNEIIRISPRALNKTELIEKEVTKLTRISRLAKGGGVLLAGVNLALTGVKLKAANSADERAVIVAEEAGSIAGAAAAGVAIEALVGVVLVSNPVGWVALAVLVGGSVAGATIGEKVANVLTKKALKTETGRAVDVWIERQFD